MFVIALRAVGLACLLAGLIHASLGVGGDWVLGIVPARPIDPSLDSQNRFYGTAFALYGVIFWVGSSDLNRYAPILKCAIGLLFLAGVARVLAALIHGWPTPQVIGLWVLELAAPLFWLWLNRELKEELQ